MPEQVDIKQMTGAVDFDSPNEVMPQGSVRMARNVEWFGVLPNLRPQSIVGNTLIPNSLLPGSGTNKTIGRHYDAVKKRLFFFNYNSAGNHHIDIFYTLTATFQRLVQSGTMTNGDVLNFNLTTRIHSIGIIYGDGQDGDLLCFVDCLGRIRKINIDRFLASQGEQPSWTGTTYSTFQSTYLNLIKGPPLTPPYCVYENDATVTQNNLINALFNISCAHIYDDFEISVFSSGAKQPLPSDPFDPQNNTDKTRNARIAIYLPTGDQNVRKIRIYGTQTKDGITSTPFIIDTLIKADLGIPDNTFYRYLFYNNGNPITADPKLALLDYDWVPDANNTFSILNGNVISCSGCTEGYPFNNPSFNFITSNGVPSQYSINGTLFFGATNGQFTGSQPQITLYLTGVGTNDGFGNPITLEKYPTLLTVRAKSNGVDVGFSVAAVTSNISDNITRLHNAAVTAGWVFVSNTTNTLTIYYPTGSVFIQDVLLNGGIVLSTSPYPSAVSAHYPEAAYSYGILEIDGNGKNGGVLSNTTGNIKTQLFADGDIPLIYVNLSGFVPSSWAVAWELVRTDNLTYQKYLDWVSAAAYQGTGTGTSTVYAYFDVSNISAYNLSKSATEGVISYSFSPGDRVRVLGRYNSAGAFTPLNLDYAIIGSPVQIVANGVIKTGQFIQIYYPAGDINANFQFPTATNDTDFQNYKILIYSYKAFLPTNQNTYFRIGQQYGIGNQGTPGAYYMGNIADNQVILSDGDVFYRQRTVPLISTYNIPTGSFDQTSPYGTLWVNPGGGAIPIVDNGIWKIVGGVQKVAGLLGSQYPTYVENDFTIFNETVSQTLSVRLRGTQPVTDKTDPNGQFSMYVKVVLPGNVVQLTQILPLQTGMQPGVSNNFVFDATIQLPPQGKLWIINHAVNEMLVGGFSLTLDVIRSLSINVFDASQSDIYALRTNSDNKPNVINTDAKTTKFNTLFRYSLAYEAGTNINNTNRFYFENSDEFPREHGAVVRTISWGKRIRVYQERKVGEIGVYSKFIKNQTGTLDLIASDTIIEQNNIQYFEENFGLANQPSALIVSGYQNYFPDAIRGAALRTSLDGVKNISEEFNVQSFVGENFVNYLNSYAYQFGGDAVILGTYNYKKDKDGEVIFLLQGGTSGSVTIPGQCLVFNERKNAFTGIYSINADDIICCENQLYSFYQGNLYIHNNTTNYAQFFGVNYKPSITFVFNQQMAIKKKLMAMGYQGYNNKIWQALNVGDILTSFVDPQSGLQQISQLITEDFSIEEGSIVAAFLNDANSGTDPVAAINNGAYLEGFWLEVTLTAPDNGFNFIYAPFIKWDSSPKAP